MLYWQSTAIQSNAETSEGGKRWQWEEGGMGRGRGQGEMERKTGGRGEEEDMGGGKRKGVQRGGGAGGIKIKIDTAAATESDRRTRVGPESDLSAVAACWHRLGWSSHAMSVRSLAWQKWRDGWVRMCSSADRSRPNLVARVHPLPDLCAPRGFSISCLERQR